MQKVPYDPATSEEKWLDIWEKQKDLYHAQDSDNKEKKYYLVEFPYPSGAGLHVGHVWGYTMADVMSRKARMDGYNVLFPIGWDAFGLPTENYAIKTGVHPAKATADNVAMFTHQLKRMGFSFDWQREVNTTDPNYYRWTQWIFLQLFKKGLAYKHQMPINWCPHCKTGLANEEVESDGTHERCGKSVERRMVDQWLLKITAYADKLLEGLENVDYSENIKAQQRNWIGRSEGAYITFQVEGADTSVEVFTTRPDTLPGVTFMVIAPEHELVNQLTTEENKAQVEKYVQAAKRKSDLERAELQKEKTGVFTGSYVINPVTNEKVQIWVADYVLLNYGTGVVMGVPAHDERDEEFAKKYDLSIVPVDELGDEAITQMITKLEELGVGKRGVEYKLRDWIFSRQHYWGEPIPIVNCEQCGLVPLPEDQLPLELPDIEDYEPTDDGKSPLAKVDDWVNTECPSCGKPAKRETDTMPNWAGSSWYFLRYTDPHNDEEFVSEQSMNQFMPVDMYVGGPEHTTLHLLYSRFWHQFLYDEGLVTTSEPYQGRRNRGMILGPDGSKMSKSLGNVINPLDEVAVVGADTLRMYELFMGPYQDTFPWNPSAEKGVYKFLDRVWRMTQSVKESNHSETNKTVLSLLHKTIKKVGIDIEAMKFNTAIAFMMEFVNMLEDEDGRISVEDFKSFMLILAPFAPFMAEEMNLLLQSGDGETNDSIHAQAWPAYEEDLLVEDELTIPVQVNGKLRANITINSADIENEEAVIAIARSEVNVVKYVGSAEPKKVIYVPGRMISFVI